MHFLQFTINIPLFCKISVHSRVMLKSTQLALIHWILLVLALQATFLLVFFFSRNISFCVHAYHLWEPALMLTSIEARQFFIDSGNTWFAYMEASSHSLLEYMKHHLPMKFHNIIKLYFEIFRYFQRFFFLLLANKYSIFFLIITNIWSRKKK